MTCTAVYVSSNVPTQILPLLTGLRKMRNDNLLNCGDDNPLDGADDGIDVFFVGLPVAYADSHCASALEGGAREEGGPFSTDGSDDLVCKSVMICRGDSGRWVQKADEALVDNRPVKCLRVWRSTLVFAAVLREPKGALVSRRRQMYRKFFLVHRKEKYLSPTAHLFIEFLSQRSTIRVEKFRVGQRSARQSSRVDTVR